MTSPVFISARFRSGSTLLWNLFRQVPEATAYYEPLHEKLPQMLRRNIAPQPTHFHVDTYFREYPPLEELAAHHHAAFGVYRLYLEAEDEFPALQAWIRYLFDHAGQEGIPVFQFNRVDFRIPWLKAHFANVPVIHLYRSPRDQWLSSIHDYPGEVDGDVDADPYLITTWARDLCAQFPFLAGDFLEHAYQRHYYLWKLSYLAGSRLADLSIAYESLLQTPEDVTRSLLAVAGLDTLPNVEQAVKIIVPRPIDKWKEYRDEAWFVNLERACESVLDDLGLNEHFGTRPLREIIAASPRYRDMIADPRVRDWATRHAQQTVVLLENVADDKEAALQEISAEAEVRRKELLAKEEAIQDLYGQLKAKEKAIQNLIVYRQTSLRYWVQRVKGRLIRFIPSPILRVYRALRSLRQPKLGTLHQYSPKVLNIPKRYTKTRATPAENLPTISIVTPSYNQAEFLERTIKSVVDQGYPKLEYIVQDGGSTDGTDRILEQYAPRLTHIESRKDKGQADAVNLGFAHASGQVMAWLNSDDMLVPGTLHYVGQFFAQHPEVDVVYGHRVIVDEDDQEIGRWVLPPHDSEVLSWADYVPQETLFWRREVWERAGGGVGENFHFALDWDLLIRFREAGATFRRLPRFLACFRVHMQQKTSAQIGERGYQEMARVRERVHGRPVTPAEINEHIRGYLRKHTRYDVLYRLGIVRY